MIVISLHLIYYMPITILIFTVFQEIIWRPFFVFNYIHHCSQNCFKCFKITWYKNISFMEICQRGSISNIFDNRLINDRFACNFLFFYKVIIKECCINIIPDRKNTCLTKPINLTNFNLRQMYITYVRCLSVCWLFSTQETRNDKILHKR